MSVIVSSRIPAGSIKDIQVNDGNLIELSIDMRDSSGQWFFWNFKAAFDTPGDYIFQFRTPNTVGSRAAAVSRDNGYSWTWLGADARINDHSFRYHCSRPEELIFCTGMEYLQEHFDLFRYMYIFNPAFRVSELCKSREGRSVELASVREGNPPWTILLTSRHHCCEMMATYALEGILKTVLANSDFAREFRRHFEILAVPFVDKDGVENGDQGKNRQPHDHARDYGDNPIYPETRAIMKLIQEKRPVLIMDLHCPWIFSGSNEAIHIPGSSDPYMKEEEAVFSGILEKYAPASAPYHASDNIPYGTSWNTGANYTQGKSLKYYAVDCFHQALENHETPYPVGAFTLEIPYANARDVTLTVSSMTDLGKALAETVWEYLKEKLHL